MKTSARKPSTKKVPKSAAVPKETAATVTVTEPIEIKETNDVAVWEVKALKTIDDPDFTYADTDPDAKLWDAAFASLQSKGFMIVEQDPKNPQNSLFVMTTAGREALDQL